VKQLLVILGLVLAVDHLLLDGELVVKQLRNLRNS
jgi:hypothetical protein